MSDKTNGWRADAAWSPAGVEVRLVRDRVDRVINSLIGR